jgi:hypothetical protein
MKGNLVFEPDKAWVLPDTIIGVELEYESSNTDGSNWYRDQWSQVGDGSLRNGGVEFVSHPVFGVDLTKALATITKGFDRGYFSGTVNYRTGLHIHMDVSEMELTELQSLLTLYALFERTLFRYCGNARDDNPYCVPYYKSPNALAVVALLDWQSIPIEIVSSHIGRNVEKTAHTTVQHRIVERVSALVEKYSALNLRPILQQGSIEFRHALSTTNMEDVREWIQILMSLKRAALEMTSHDALEMMMSRGAMELAHFVFGDYMNSLPLEGLEEDVDNCLFFAKEISHGVSSKQDWLALRSDEVVSHPGWLSLVGRREEYFAARGKEQQERWDTRKRLFLKQGGLVREPVIDEGEFASTATASDGLRFRMPPPMRSRRTVPTPGQWLTADAVAEMATSAEMLNELTDEEDV